MRKAHDLMDSNGGIISTISASYGCQPQTSFLDEKS